MHAQFESSSGREGGREAESKGITGMQGEEDKKTVCNTAQVTAAVCVDVLMELETAREDDDRFALATPPNGGAWALF